MADVTRHIGLSLGADLCWPASYEALVEKLDLKVKVGNDTVSFDVERVTVEPFDLSYKPKYDIVLDRLTHWYMVTREWMKKIVVMDDVYVLNNPWSVQSMEKHTTYCAMMRLGMPIPKTWMLPAKEYKRDEWDTDITVKRYNRLFNLSEIGDSMGYPSFIKPYDGGGWVGVAKVDDARELGEAYDKSGTRVHHLQEGVNDYEVFVRAIGVGPQVHIVKYDPSAPLHGRYTVDFHFLDAEQWAKATRITRTINSFFGWDFNSCEMLLKDGVLYPIDFANACPDSQVTSLNYHFPWLVTALLRWSLFCAATKRKKPMGMQWERYFAIGDDASIDYEDKLVKYDEIAREFYDTDAFVKWNEENLGDLDTLALEFFGTPKFKTIVRSKVASLYPEHEVDTFTNHFFGMVQFWRKTESDRLGVPIGDVVSPTGSEAAAEEA